MIGRFALSAFCVSLCLCPASRADVSVSTVLNLTDFTIVPNAGRLAIADVMGSVAAAAADNLGDSESHSIVASPLPISVFAAAGSLARARAIAALSGASARARVSIPGQVSAEAVSVSETRISGFFEILTRSGTPAPVGVDFGATLTGRQNLSTDAFGLFAASEVDFDFTAAGTPQFSYTNQASIGSNAVSDSPISQSLSSTASLFTNTPYRFVFELDSESFGVNSPEPGYFLTLGAGMLVLLGFRKRWQRI